MIESIVEHVPVLSAESLTLLQVEREGVYVDCTTGLGGHAEAIVSRLEGTGRLIGLDRDGSALERTRKRLEPKFSNFSLHRRDFKDLPQLLDELSVGGIDGCLLDLGVSSLQLDSPERGFSFRHEGPLDMRMDRCQSTTAAQVVNTFSETELARVFRQYGEERQARKIAAAVVRRRALSPLRTTTQLAALVEQVKGSRRSRIHPATQVFQALRIEVNQELAGLEKFLRAATGCLVPGGRIVVISFHSLEDRLAKRAFRIEAGRCVCFRPGNLCTCPRVEKVRILTPKPMTPTPGDIALNPRARSAKLRAAERIDLESSSAARLRTTGMGKRG
ncbi:MAG: 16S rRNA (cytosine(1402)-N(4))-methyltransferase RsmH [Acidobacteriota bacterium]